MNDGVWGVGCRVWGFGGAFFSFVFLFFPFFFSFLFSFFLFFSFLFFFLSFFLSFFDLLSSVKHFWSKSHPCSKKWRERLL